MERFGLRDDQWDRIKDILPGREGHVGGTAPVNVPGSALDAPLHGEAIGPRHAAPGGIALGAPSIHDRNEDRP
jgi:hypothetical protein